MCQTPLIKQTDPAAPLCPGAPGLSRSGERPPAPGRRFRRRKRRVSIGEGSMSARIAVRSTAAGRGQWGIGTAVQTVQLAIFLAPGAVGWPTDFLTSRHLCQLAPEPLAEKPHSVGQPTAPPCPFLVGYWAPTGPKELLPFCREARRARTSGELAATRTGGPGATKR